jgi:hypothetical protein
MVREMAVAKGADGQVSLRVEGVFTETAVKRPLKESQLDTEIKILEELDLFREHMPGHPGGDFVVRLVKKLEGGGYEVRMHESTKQLQVLSCHAS